jgi:Ca2+/Na+ antiporter
MPSQDKIRWVAFGVYAVVFLAITAAFPRLLYTAAKWMQGCGEHAVLCASVAAACVVSIVVIGVKTIILYVHFRSDYRDARRSLQADRRNRRQLLLDVLRRSLFALMWSALVVWAFVHSPEWLGERESGNSILIWGGIYLMLDTLADAFKLIPLLIFRENVK